MRLITNEEIYTEIMEMKKLLKQLLDATIEVRTLEEDIKFFEGRQAVDEEKIAKAVKKKRFQSIVEWKNVIWDRCPYKKEIIGKDSVTFHCQQLNAPCMFEGCPRNWVEEEPYRTTNRP